MSSLFNATIAQNIAYCRAHAERQVFVGAARMELKRWFLLSLYPMATTSLLGSSVSGSAADSVNGFC
jgi:hypothetical protein